MKHLRIIRHGELDPDAGIDAQVRKLTAGVSEVIVPDGDGDATHWWIVFADHIPTAYFGTMETFARWQTEGLSRQ